MSDFARHITISTKTAMTPCHYCLYACMIDDTVSLHKPEPSISIENPEEVRVKRDQQLALDYVRRGGGVDAVPAIAEATGVNLRTVYRAVKRQLEWAREQHALELKSAPASDIGAGRADLGADCATPEGHYTSPSAPPESHDPNAKRSA